MSDPIRLLVVDDHAVVRRGIRAIISAVPDMQLVAEAENGGQAVALCGQTSPDVVVMDLVMPGMSGVEAIRAIKSSQPNLPILVLTSFAGNDKVFPAIKAGASGYLLKDSSMDMLVEAIRQVVRGEPSLHPAIAQKLLQELKHNHDGEHRPRGNAVLADDELTEREEEILKLVARGLSNHQIADALYISEATVRTHVSNILTKLHLTSRTQAVLYALREGLASLDDEGISESIL